ncbi:MULTISPECIES: hypothetical protein [unclassified Bradyrhizobium]|uniref:hypothetical protein n=1 Tax=unclassified Bradyrhizobium TaxID=2631580 RepID=UPI0020B2E557|nr:MULTISPECIES: hypothetical protein [unclassified Bradyrhizobium]MCP3397101.1 hypothetical protein [Bradyrhizobium sp. CCGB20]MCP3405613.1 hypothetical protein [Bradyrhizobium sp. CCGB01]
MSIMTDPTDALVSFQQALLAGAREFQRGSLIRSSSFISTIRMVARSTYVRLQGRVVTAHLMAVDPIEGIPCFQIGVAAPEEYRRRGLATDVVPADQPWCWGGELFGERDHCEQFHMLRLRTQWMVTGLSSNLDFWWSVCVAWKSMC